MKIQFNKTYEFDFTGKVSFGDLPAAALNALYQDGRVANTFLEHYIPIWFPELRFVNARGYDHIDKHDVKYDLKNFTIKTGARYMPSKMIGGGRIIDIPALHAHANSINYIFADIVEFPKVRVIFKTGTDMVIDYPRGTVPLKERKNLFG